MLMRALELAPGDPDTIAWSVPTLAYVGQGELALETAERALRLSPDDPSLFRNEHFRSIAHYGLGQYAEAADWGLSAMRRQPGYTSNLRFTAAALGASARIDEAKEVAARLCGLQPKLRASEAAGRSAFLDPAIKNAYRRHLCAAGVPD
jgi:tetratricopeptide (TPR) repeat protein